MSLQLCLAGTSNNLLLNLPAAALAGALVQWLLQQQAAKLKAAQALTDRKRGSPHKQPARSASSSGQHQRSGRPTHASPLASRNILKQAQNESIWDHDRDSLSTCCSELVLATVHSSPATWAG